MTNDEAKAIAAGTVEAIKPRLATLSVDDLGLLRQVEMAGASRATLIAAIDAATGDNMTAGTPSGDDAAPRAIVPDDLSGKSLDQLETLRTLELARVGGDAGQGEVARVDQAIADLRQAGKDAPEIDTGTTKAKYLPTPATADAIKAGPVSLELYDGATLIRGAPTIELTAADFAQQHGRLVLQKAIRLSGALERAQLTHVVLEDEDEQIVGTCEIPSVLHVGGGREAELPAGTIAF